MGYTVGHLRGLPAYEVSPLAHLAAHVKPVAGPRAVWRTLSPGILALCLFAVGVRVHRIAGAAAAAAANRPAAQVDLARLGYTGLSAAARQSGGANLSVDFLDADHV